MKSVKNLQAVIDVSDVTSRKKSMNVQLKPVDKLGNEVKGISLSAEKADVTVQMYSTKSVPLNVQTTGRIQRLGGCAGVCPDFLS